MDGTDDTKEPGGYGKPPESTSAWQTCTGLSATHLVSGKTFNEL